MWHFDGMNERNQEYFSFKLYGQLCLYFKLTIFMWELDLSKYCIEGVRQKIF